MKRNLLRLGLLSLLLVFAFIAKAQNVTAVWDFQKNLPEGINTAANFQGNEGDLASTVEGITMHVSAIQEKALYTTDFTEWKKVDGKTANNTLVDLKTLYSKEAFTMTLNGVEINPTGTNAKFADRTGYMKTLKYTGEYSTAEPSAVTSPLASITKITLHQAATGGTRGIKVSVKGDGDADWVTIHNVSIATTSGEDLTLDVNRTNCQIKFEGFKLSQNAYVTDLAIYGNVDMSKTPMLGTFSLNGTKYSAVDIFKEDASGKQFATLLVSKKTNLISETNPLKDLVAANGTIKSTTYTTTGEGADQKTVVTIVVESNGDKVTYELTVAFKPDFTLTYYNIDGTTAIGTQKVEQDANIEKFQEGMEEKVTVAEGKKFRGWATDLKKDSKKFTTSSIITADTNLYAVVTDIETASETVRYDYDLQKEGFDINDHEAISVEGKGKWHDATHGWSFEATDKLKVKMGGKGYIKMNLCQYSKSGKIILLDPKGNEVSSINAKPTKDGNLGILRQAQPLAAGVRRGVRGLSYPHFRCRYLHPQPQHRKHDNSCLHTERQLDGGKGWRRTGLHHSPRNSKRQQY